MREPEALFLICVYNTLLDGHKFNHDVYIMGAKDVVWFLTKDTYQKQMRREFEWMTTGILTAYFGPTPEENLDLNKLKNLFSDFRDFEDGSTSLFTEHSYYIHGNISEIKQYVRNILEKLDIYYRDGMFSLEPDDSYIAKVVN